MSKGFPTPEGRRQLLCKTPEEAREAEAGQAPDGQTISTNQWSHIGPKWREIVIVKSVGKPVEHS